MERRSIETLLYRWYLRGLVLCEAGIVLDVAVTPRVAAKPFPWGLPASFGGHADRASSAPQNCYWGQPMAL